MSLRDFIRVPFVQMTLALIAPTSLLLATLSLAFAWVHDEITQLRNDVAVVGDKVTELQIGGAVLENRVTTLGSRIDALGSRIDALGSRIDKIENHRLARIEKAILENTKSLISLQYSITKPTPGPP